MFYNGTQNEPDELELKLSEAYLPELRELADIEVRVRMININYGRNQKILETCRPLGEYAWFVEEIRKSQREGNNLENAVEEAVRTMPGDFMIKPLIAAHRAEVRVMLEIEYNEAAVMALFKEDGRREGRKEGLEEGLQEGLKEGLKEGLRVSTAILHDLGINEEDIIEKIMDKCKLSREEAEALLK